jgi:hypothetical protein
MSGRCQQAKRLRETSISRGFGLESCAVGDPVPPSPAKTGERSPPDRPVDAVPNEGGDRMTRLKGRVARTAAALAGLAALAFSASAMLKW